MRSDVLKIKESDGGVAVRIYATDGSKSFPIHGAYNRGDAWHNACWREDGLYLIQQSSEVSRCDLDITGVPFHKPDKEIVPSD